MKITTKVGVVGVLALGLSSVASPALASEGSESAGAAESVQTATSASEVPQSTVDLVWKIAESEEAFRVDENGRVSFAVEESMLTDSFGFTEQEISELTTAFGRQTYAGSAPVLNAQSTPLSTAATAESGARILYMDTPFLTAGVGAALLAAAEVGPVALTAAWTAFTATFSGPIAIGAAVLGATFFADLAVKIVGAVAQNKGVAIYVDWGIPPLKSVIE